MDINISNINNGFLLRGNIDGKWGLTYFRTLKEALSAIEREKDRSIKDEVCKG